MRVEYDTNQTIRFICAVTVTLLGFYIAVAAVVLAPELDVSAMVAGIFILDAGPFFWRPGSRPRMAKSNTPVRWALLLPIGSAIHLIVSDKQAIIAMVVLVPLILLGVLGKKADAVRAD